MPTHTEIEASLKSLDTEEPIDLLFYRPMGYRIALVAAHWGITPNAVTLLSILLGVGAGVLFYDSNFWVNALGILLLVVANLLDSVDGQLARLTHHHTLLGRILDGVAGELWFITIYIALSLRMIEAGWSGWIFLLTTVAGLSHALQASMGDYYRNLHLYFIKAGSGVELRPSPLLQRRCRGVSWRSAPLYKLLLCLYIGYTRLQERLSPHVWELRQVIKSRYGSQPPPWLVLQFRQESLRYINYTNILSFNTRALLLVVALLLNFPLLFLLFELLLLNPLLYYTVVQYEAIAQTLIHQIDHYENP